MPEEKPMLTIVVGGSLASEGELQALVPLMLGSATPQRLD